jgi:hypothetical protein
MPFALFALAMINVAVGTQGFAFAGVLADIANDLGLDRPGEQGFGAVAQHSCELVGECSWLNQADNVVVRHGISLLWWRSEVVKQPHDMPPSRFEPSPSFAHCSSAEARLT